MKKKIYFFCPIHLPLSTRNPHPSDPRALTPSPPPPARPPPNPPTPTSPTTPTPSYTHQIAQIGYPPTHVTRPHTHTSQSHSARPPTHARAYPRRTRPPSSPCLPSPTQNYAPHTGWCAVRCAALCACHGARAKGVWGGSKPGLRRAGRPGSGVGLTAHRLCPGGALAGGGCHRPGGRVSLSSPGPLPGGGARSEARLTRVSPEGKVLLQRHPL